MNFFKGLMFFMMLSNFSIYCFSQQMPALSGTSTAEDASGEEVSRESKSGSGKALPVLEIKRLESEDPMYSIELRDVELANFFRVIAHEYGLNFLVDEELTGKVTASLTNVSLNEALDLIAEMNNVALIKRGNIIQVKANLKTKIFFLNHTLVQEILNSKSGQNLEEGAIKEKTIETTKGASGGGIERKSETTLGTTGVSEKLGTIYDLLSSKGKAFQGKNPNSFMVIDYPDNLNRVQEYIDMLDTRMTKKLFKLKYINAKELSGVSSSGASESEGAGAAEGTAGAE